MAEIRKRQIRSSACRRRVACTSSDEEHTEGSNDNTRLGNLKELQQLRKRSRGIVSAGNALEYGDQTSTSVKGGNVRILSRLEDGGMVDLSKFKNGDLRLGNIEDDIKNQFSRESQLRDEDEEMQKFVQEELDKLKGVCQQASKEEAKSSSVEEKLFELPDHLKKYQSKTREDMLSNQMLCGIPEVDLGIDQRIVAVEKTELSKQKMLTENRNEKNLPNHLAVEALPSCPDEDLSIPRFSNTKSKWNMKKRLM